MTKPEEMTVAEYNNLMMEDMERQLRAIAERLSLGDERTERVVGMAMKKAKEKK